MLRVVPNRELAREAARLNVSALIAGQARVVPTDAGVGLALLRDAIERSDGDLGLIRRAVSRLLDRAAPTVSRVTPPRARELGPKR